MGAILKFILIIIGFFFILSLMFGSVATRYLLRLIFRGRKSSTKTHNNRQEPASQTERIISYKKKEFESTSIEDVEFEEIKDDK